MQPLPDTPGRCPVQDGRLKSMVSAPGMARPARGVFKIIEDK